MDSSFPVWDASESKKVQFDAGAKFVEKVPSGSPVSAFDFLAVHH